MRRDFPEDLFMKRIILTFTLAALSFSTFAYDASAFITPTGAVKEYTKTTYSITEKFGDYYRSPSAVYTHTFNASGLESETSEFTNKNALVDRLVYEYDAARRRISQTCYDTDGKISWKVVTTYDATGNKTDESEYNASNAITSKSIYKYTGDKQVEEAYYNADGALLWKSVTKFDDLKRTAEIDQYYAEGNLDGKRIYVYNDAGKLSEIDYIDADGTTSKKTVYRFDANSVVTEEQTYNGANKLTNRIIYKYDATGNLIKTTTYSVADKFGSTVNELAAISEYSYKF
jgi:antitoxin component YwqK of YwqJK toxin-antitoxin module